MKNTQTKMIDNAQEIFTLVALGEYTWIHLAGYTCCGKSVLLQAIVDNAVASDDRPIIYTFNPQGMGDETIKEARKMEKSIYLLQRKCQDGLQTRKVFVAIHGWHLMLSLASDPRRLYVAILDIFNNSREWGVVFGITIQAINLTPMYNNLLRGVSDGLCLKIILGDRALETARQTWKTLDARYLWLLDQKRPCVISNNGTLNVAIVPEIPTNKPKKQEQNARQNKVD